MADFWSHRDLKEDVFDIDDLLDAHEILQIRHENQLRAQEAAERKNHAM